MGSNSTKTAVKEVTRLAVKHITDPIEPDNSSRLHGHFVHRSLQFFELIFLKKIKKVTGVMFIDGTLYFNVDWDSEARNFGKLKFCGKSENSDFDFDVVTKVKKDPKEVEHSGLCGSVRDNPNLRGNGVYQRLFAQANEIEIRNSRAFYAKYKPRMSGNTPSVVASYRVNFGVYRQSNSSQYVQFVPEGIILNQKSISIMERGMNKECQARKLNDPSYKMPTCGIVVQTTETKGTMKKTALENELLLAPNQKDHPKT
ncbi:hypothetical protein L5515_015725 [Caenorhabditis briggsae]|uniref:Uncharacterized protein n=1 Tax=Caenorhabditis briggsae TaxID=6238 RepID=A0AAE9JAJ2_CAEBR|nr:hypothetical protein L5515_015725 [Caenorhabditis briggsae]